MHTAAKQTIQQNFKTTHIFICAALGFQHSLSSGKLLKHWSRRFLLKLENLSMISKLAYLLMLLAWVVSRDEG